MKLIYQFYELLDFVQTESKETGRWELAKPLNPISVRSRIRAMWLVLLGNGIVVRWY